MSDWGVGYAFGIASGLAIGWATAEERLVLEQSKKKIRELVIEVIEGK